MDLPSEMLAWSGRCLCFGRPRWQWLQLFSLGSGEERRLIFWTAAGNRAYEGSYFIPSFVLFFFVWLVRHDWAGKRRPPLLVLYICHIVCYTAFFFVVAQRFPLPPSLLSLWRLSRVGWQKEGVGSSGLPQERQDYYTFLLLPHP